MNAPFGWTVIWKPGTPVDAFHVYKRDCPADAAHFSADLAPFTHASKRLAIEAGKRGEKAYKHLQPVHCSQCGGTCGPQGFCWSCNRPD